MGAPVSGGGAARAARRHRSDGALNVVTPHYFSTLGIVVVAGRPFDTRDKAETTPVMIVSRYFAERMFPNESPIGKRVRSWRRPEHPARGRRRRRGSKLLGAGRTGACATGLRPYSQDIQFGMLVVARSRGIDASALPGAVRRALSAVDPEMGDRESQPALGVGRPFGGQRNDTRRSCCRCWPRWRCRSPRLASMA